ncbi:nucleotidyltransferase domain-containing protein [Cytobacillus firmus]|uniref:nucleotidyltransferase domain-containing protein n=1 Tax=Cytobacillus firmus TaxID=1399 RepID=UPI0024C10CDB|nr:nucleotidyltransferase family protein [Cytobacillus firmus]WHY61138.1 nucleotidyltransferase family protein [Cytobacillus firmus]
MEDNFSLEVKHIPKELKFILEIIKKEDVKELQSYLKEWLKDIDWNLFLELTIHHRVYPLLLEKLKMIDQSLIPANVMKSITNLYKMNTLQMLHFSCEMEQVCKMFDKHQIRLLVLKGPVLGEDLYGDISRRTSGDLDFLISIKDMDKVNELLLKNGYKKDDYIKTVLNDWRWRHHHVTYYHTQKKIKLEIHWRLNPGPGLEPTFNELWARRRISSITSFPVHYLGREDLFLFLVSHGARHGWSRLRWLIDIDKLVKQRIDWIKLARLLTKYQFNYVGGQALVLASQILSMSITKEMTIIKGNHPKRLAQGAIFYLERMVNLHNEPVPDEIAKYHKRYLFLLMSNKQKVLFIMSFLYPYPEDAETLPLPKLLHFLYFPLRPFLWAWRKTMKHALLQGER